MAIRLETIEEPDGDLLLHVLVKLAHEDMAEVSVTVTVGGTVISGHVISHDKWLAECRNLVDADADPNAAKFMESLRSAVQEADKEHNSDGDDLHLAHFHYLHLKDAYILERGNFFPHGQGMLWRGRLSEVSGWSFQRFKPND